MLRAVMEMGDGDADGELRCKMQDGVGGDKMVG
jgi:hypothetical protein